MVAVVEVERMRAKSSRYRVSKPKTGAKAKVEGECWRDVGV